MKILIARLNHETNTFSPVPTPLAAFDPQYGADALAGFRGTRTAMGAFIDQAEALGATLVTPVAASATQAEAHAHLATGKSVLRVERVEA